MEMHRPLSLSDETTRRRFLSVAVTYGRLALLGAGLNTLLESCGDAGITEEQWEKLTDPEKTAELNRQVAIAVDFLASKIVHDADAREKTDVTGASGWLTVTGQTPAGSQQAATFYVPAPSLKFPEGEYRMGITADFESDGYSNATSVSVVEAMSPKGLFFYSAFTKDGDNWSLTLALPIKPKDQEGDMHTETAVYNTIDPASLSLGIWQNIRAETIKVYDYATRSSDPVPACIYYPSIKR